MPAATPDRPAAAAPAPRRARALAALTLGLYAAVAAAGTWFLFQPTLASGFSLLQPDPGDSLLNDYLLEHELRVIERPDHLGTFWSPPFFHPARNVLAYSENLMGMLPVYALLRLRWDPVVSYQLLLILLCLADYLAMLLVLRRLGVGPPLAALGAFVFAFGAARGAQVSHIQLFAVFYAPLALWALWRLLAAPSRGRLALFLLLLYLQLLSGIYMGWFLLLALALLVPLLLSWDRDGRRRVAAFCRDAPLFVPLAAAVWAAASYLTLRPYLAASAELGARPWADVQLFLPRLRSWFTSPPGSPYHEWLGGFPPGARVVWEHYLFPGLVPLALGIVSAVYTLRLSRDERRRQALLVACWMAALLLVAISLSLPRLGVEGLHLVRRYPGASLWWFVFRWVPGAQAIRAVGRISVLVYLLAVVAACWGADAAIHRSRLRPAVRTALLAALLLAGVAEQRAASPPAFEKARFFRHVAAVRAGIPPGCRMLYLTTKPGESYLVTQLVAMWAGLDAHLPVVNGYSGNAPPRYPQGLRTWSAGELAAWSGDDPCVVAEP